MAQYQPIETEVQSFSDHSIGENAQSSAEGSAVRFENLNTRDHLRLRDYTVDERPNLLSILTFSKLSDLLQRTPPRRVAQSHENGAGLFKSPATTTSPEIRTIVLRNVSARKGTTSYEAVKYDPKNRVQPRVGRSLSVEKIKSFTKPCEVLSEADDDIQDQKELSDYDEPSTMVKYKESKKWTSSYFKLGAPSNSDHDDSILDNPSLIQNSNLFSHLLDLDNSILKHQVTSKFAAQKLPQSPRTPEKFNEGASKSYFGKKTG